MSISAFIRRELFNRGYSQYEIDYILRSTDPDIIVRDYHIEVTDEECLEFLDEFKKLLKTFRR